MEESLVWARDATKRHPADDRYRPIAPAWYWGQPAGAIIVDRVAGRVSLRTARSAGERARVAEMRRRPRPREAPEDEDDEGSGTWVIRADEPQESVEDPFGLQRPADHDEHADPEGLADSLSELPGSANRPDA